MPQSLKSVQIWIYTGCVMILLMVLLGGITRLTDSGLSIVDWKPIMGAIPPLSEAQWNETFQKYQQIPQYKRVNQGMTLSEFKHIFFWEYLHRMWGRLLGLAFVVPFFFFLYKRMLSRGLLLKLMAVFFLGGLQGFVGWYMVQSGLSENISVSHLRLAMHLIMAILLYSYLLYIGFSLQNNTSKPIASAVSRKILNISGMLIALLYLQLFYGALMAGLKAGLFYPTYPFMNNQIIPDGFSTMDTWYGNLFSNITTVQFIHRNIPILLGILLLVLWQYTKALEEKKWQNGFRMILLVFGLQCLLGIVTLLNCVGHIPVIWGVFHQMGALLLLTFCLLFYFKLHKTASLKYSLSNHLRSNTN